MAIKTLDVDLIVQPTGNLYESIAVLSKRARQISTEVKTELDAKLTYYEGFDPELEDPRFQEEQARVSLEYEVRPEPTELAIDQFVEGEVYFRGASEEDSL